MPETRKGRRREMRVMILSFPGPHLFPDVPFPGPRRYTTPLVSTYVNYDNVCSSLLENRHFRAARKAGRTTCQAGEQALDRMIDQAISLGANGVVCARFTTSTVMQGAAELLAYGTAVIIDEE